MIQGSLIRGAKSALASETARSASWLFAGQVANLLLQAAYFLLLARLLGVAPYGVFAAAFALVNTVTPYSALGSQMLFMRYVSLVPGRARAFWGNSLITILLTSFAMGVIVLLVAPHFLHAAPRGLIASLVLANCVMSQISTCASSALLTLHRVRAAAVNRLLSNAMRAVAIAVMLIVMGKATAEQWGFGILLSSSVAALLSLVWVHRVVGGIAWDLPVLREYLWEGLGFSFAGSTESVYNDLDKVLLSHYNMNSAAGIYTVAYRIVDFATAPVSSLVSAVMPRWFARSKMGLRAVADACPRLLAVALMAGAAAAVFVFLGSPWIIDLVGHGFAESAAALRWLCLLPVLRAVHQVVGSILTATGWQSRRTAAQFATGLVNLGLNVWLIPLHGWRGAAWASLASDGLLGVLNVSLVLYHLRRAQPPPRGEADCEGDAVGAETNAA